MTRILTGVKVRHAPCGAILRRITASKGSKGRGVFLLNTRPPSAMLAHEPHLASACKQAPDQPRRSRPIRRGELDLRSRLVFLKAAEYVK